jgi:peptidoglycan hydrolase-like protein with peptidoglycan-binding domain
MSYYLCKSLVTMRDQANKAAPNRSKVSDGWIGNTEHAARKSDHNPLPNGAVLALDLTHDLAHGFDSSKWAENVRTSKDPRLSYVISMGRIANPAIEGGAWRAYHGTNAHTHHCHTSVLHVEALYDDPALWKIAGVVQARLAAPTSTVPAAVPVIKPRALKKGLKGEDIRTLQAALNAKGAKPQLKVDGSFGPATKTAVVAFQKAHGIPADGVVDVGGRTAMELTPEETIPLGPYLGARILKASRKFDTVVQHYEAKVNKAYVLDGILHAGYGHAFAKNQTEVKEGDVVSDMQCELWYGADKAIAEKRLLKNVTGRLNQDQFDAVCSIIWNGGDWDDPTDKADSPLFYKTPYGVLAEALNKEDWVLSSKILVALGNKPTRTGRVFRGIGLRRLTEDEVFRGVKVTLR